MNRQSDTLTTVHGKVVRTKIIVRDGTFIVQSLLQTADFPVVCIWKATTIKEAELHDYTAISVTGSLQEHNGRRWMLQPNVATQATRRSRPARPLQAAAKAAPKPKKSIKNIFVAAFVIASFLAISAIAHQPATTTASIALDNTNASATQTAESTDLANTASKAAIATPRTVTTTPDSSPAPSPASQSSSTDTPYDCQYLSIPYTSTTKNDSTLAAGTSRISTYGVTGSKKVCYPNGRQRAPVTTIIYPATTKVTSVGTYVAQTYTNSAGNSVPSPTNSGSASLDGYSPTATCRDGTTSYSQSHSGTCSSHGGVASWY